MPNPTQGDVHVNAPLTNVSIAWTQSNDMFVADKVFPNVPVAKQSDRYYIYDRDDWFRSEARVRAPSTESAGAGYRLDNTPTYYAPVLGLHKDIDDHTRSNQDSVINVDRDATEYITMQLLLKREIDWAARYFTTSVWTGSTTGGDITPATLWNDQSSTPIEDIRAQIEAVHERTGMRPNKLTLGSKVWNQLQDHTDFLERIKYTQRAIVGTDLLASLLGLSQVLVAGAVRNSGPEGGTGSTGYIAGKHALLTYSAPSPGLMQPTAGYTFSWTGYLGAGPQGQRIKRFRMDHLNSDRVEGEMAYDQKVVSAELGAFFANVVA